MRSLDDPTLPAPDTDPPAPRLREEPAPASRPDAHVVERCAWTLVWLGVVGAGFSAWGLWTASATLTVLAPVIVLAGTAGMVATWLTATPRARTFQWLTLVVVVIALVASQYGSIHTRRFYTTDSAAFDHVAALSLIHGHDPYTETMSGARALLDMPARYWTYTVDGGHVDDVSYPAGSFLVVAPAMALGLRHDVVDWVDLVAWIATALVLFVLLPSALGWLAGLLVLTPLFVGTFGSGGTDAAFLPFLVLAVWRWDRFGEDRGAGAARWIGPVALGVACAIKQSPWFCVPFLVAGVALEAHRRGRRPLVTALRYAAVVVAVFSAVNLPFIAWHAGAWLHGTVTPFAQSLVADGQGLVSLATHGIVKGVDLGDLALCGALVYVALLAAFVGTYPRLRRVWLLLVPLALFVSARSLSSYLVDFVPAAVVGAFTVGTGARSEEAEAVVAGDAAGDGAGSAAGPDLRRVRSWSAAVLGLCALGAVVSGVVAFVNPPLQLAVRGVATAADGLRMAAVTVTVRNLTGTAQVPHVLVDMGSHPSGFWLPRDGRMGAVAPHASRTFTLYPPVYTYTAVRGQQWLVEAYTSAPQALSTSALQVGSRPPLP